MNIFSVITLLGGLGLFLYGMEVMGDGLKNSSGETLKKFLGKLTQSTVMGVITGTLVTAVIQSSTATIVLTVGLVTAGILNLKQAVSIVMGANIGTTATAQIIRLMDIDSAGNKILEFFKPSTLAPVAIIIGIILIMFIKKRNLKNVGDICMGFGVLFTGLMSMTAAVEPLAESEAFANMLSMFTDAPMLGILTGLVTTVIVQSSSAMVGILQSLSVTGIMTFQVVYPIIMGINLGTCVTTAMVCSIGSVKDAKRTGIVHIAFNTIGTVVFMIGMSILQASGAFGGLWDKVVSSGDIANFQTLFNLLTAVLLVPFADLLVKLSLVIVKPESDSEMGEANLLYQSLDEKLFVSPAIAVERTLSSIVEVSEIARNNLYEAMKQFDGYDLDRQAGIESMEDVVDGFADRLEHYLVQLSKNTEGDKENRQINMLMHSSMAIERIGDHAINIDETANSLRKEGASFSAAAKVELELMMGAVEEILATTIESMRNKDTNLARMIEPLEEVIDEMSTVLRDKHVERLKKGECSVNAGLAFIEVLTNLERVADQCSNIAVLVISFDDPMILKNNHEYLHQLHIGANSEYMAEYNKKREQYITALDKLI